MRFKIVQINNTQCKRQTICKVCVVVAFVVTFLYTTKLTFQTTKDGKECFVHSGYRREFLLDDVLDKQKPQPTSGKSIFFHETSCSVDNLIKINARQACAVESAAKANPTWDVYLLFASPVGFNNNRTNLPLVDSLLSYPNVNMRNVDLWQYAQGTPVGGWLKDGSLFGSEYLNSHISDFLRYLSLYRWGGTYLDLDVIVKESFDKLLPNYAGAESENFVAAGILNFDNDGQGRDIAEMCLRDFATNFNGHDWGNNGPGVITRVLQKICKTKVPAKMVRDRCGGFEVLPIDAFYAVRWTDWRFFFEEQYLEKTLRMTNQSVAIHVWNKHSKAEKIRVGANVAYGHLAAKYCPKVYSSCGEYF